MFHGQELESLTSLRRKVSEGGRTFVRPPKCRSNIELNNRIRPFFTDPYRFLGTGDQHLLGGGLPATLNLSLVRKRQWLEVIDQRAAIERKRHSVLNTQQRSIRTYFS